MKSSIQSDKNTASRRALDRERKKLERSARRGAKLVEVRLVATEQQKIRLLAILERENLTVLRHPRQVLAAIRAVPTKTEKCPETTVNNGLVSPKTDASMSPRPTRSRKRAAVQPVDDANQLDLFT